MGIRFYAVTAEPLLSAEVSVEEVHIEPSTTGEWISIDDNSKAKTGRKWHCCQVID